MPLPIQDDIKIELYCLQNIIGDWNGIIEQGFNEEKEGERIEILESTLGNLLILRTTLNSNMDKLIDKLQKEITREKKTKSMTVNKVDNP
ncbi:hypothetical protein H6G76_32740 [Nostoc sp. FACHB-152]|uniref:hypothetical protein n=1 Tax=Nostoc sp. FACHB-152 TaxID=2692837 RepID=UPI0016822592|nr:hypothetical protein [Nostoc sp. FACHB-152]MBD2451805.1 hypothetical protein [Nostoc sp. FACHB-152]